MITPEILKFLSRLFVNEETWVQSKVFEVVGRIVVITLGILNGSIKLLLNKENNIRSSAVEAVGRIGAAAATPEILKSLGRLLADRDYNVRINAVEAIGRIGAVSATPEILKSLSRLLADEVDDVRSSAAYVVGMIGITVVMPEILKFFSGLLVDEETWVQNSAFEVVGIMIGAVAATLEIRKSLSILLAAREYSARSNVISAVEKIGMAATLEFLSTLGNALIHENCPIVISSVLKSLSEKNFIKLFRTWCSLKHVEGLMKSMPCLIAITLGGYLAGNIHSQIFWEKDAYQILIYVGASSFKEVLTVQQAQVLIHLMPTIVYMIKNRDQIKMEVCMQVVEKLPDPLEDLKLLKLKILGEQFSNKEKFLLPQYTRSLNNNSRKNSTSEQPKDEMQSQDKKSCRIM